MMHEASTMVNKNQKCYYIIPIYIMYNEFMHLYYARILK